MNLKLRLDEKLSVLIVDDDEGVREILVAALEEFDLFTSIITASNGREAFTKFNNQNFDIVITDINMPLSDGLDLLRNILNAKKQHFAGFDTILIVMSGMITAKEARRIKMLKIQHTIVKPFTVDYLSDKIQEVLIKYKKDKFEAN